MPKSSRDKNIQVFLRVRPTKKPANGLTFNEESSAVDFNVPKDIAAGYVNNQRSNYNFAFDGICNMETKQEQIFSDIAKPVVDSTLQGFNGTIFAYGQTGSGKTFTITGGAERYADRGIIPRTISYIFSQTAKQHDTNFRVSVSYLELYNDSGYDLLDENHSTKRLQDLPKVHLRENNEGQMMLSGLSVHNASTEEDALNLLFIGDTNRVVSETPMNDASTRSHCIFIVQVEAQKGGSDVKTVSRLHLVDLSGSERIARTGVDGTLLKEACSINTTLHFLGQVIECLHKKAHGENIHIPYRNSMLTLLLRDSLGGNCKTVLIATISALQADMGESISTCRFASQVAMIKNSAVRNEQLDPSLIIQRLKREITELKAEIQLLKGGDVDREALTPEEIDECKKLVNEFIENRDPGANLMVGDPLKIKECFSLMKQMYLEKSVAATPSRGDKQGYSDGPSDPALQEEIKRLKFLIQQRDNEIAIFLNMMNKNKGNAEGLALSNGNPIASAADMSKAFSKEITFSASKENEFRSANGTDNGNLYQVSADSGGGAGSRSSASSYSRGYGSTATGGTSETASISSGLTGMNRGGANLGGAPRNSLQEEVNNMLIAPINLTYDQLKQRTKAFEIFRKSYRKNEAMEDNKLLLQQKITEAKTIANRVNESRERLNSLKNKIERLRKEMAIQGMVNKDDEVEQHPEEDGVQNEIEKEKRAYKQTYEHLRDLKTEIEGINNHLHRARERMQKDFETWLQVMMQQKSGESQETTSNSVANTSSTASSRGYTGLDRRVGENLEAFYKARDEINNTSTGR
eukprot:CAMPEP_0115005330 /NCGR_PEP_ID=MMETSP0216-20121206/19789_1 /TAXON_ID=223996 /ORGANISM="Protocruzia adherens, Strain Boccale" /LENGTH=806 /DNA_ID=CAMNT_0002371599 /DNA_START=155 /DNA_END=2575 /DNA_ORIENTATION=-